MRLFTISVAVGTIVYLSTAIYIGLNVYKDTSTAADVIIVLGAKSYKDGTYNPCLEARVDHAVSLYNQGIAPTLLMTGGPDEEDGSKEGETMRKIAVERGVPPEHILVESASTSTYENMILSKKLLNSGSYSSIIVVTEPFHSPRAELTAKKVFQSGTKGERSVYVSPATQSPCWTRWTFLSRYFLREPFALLYYIVSGRV